MISPEKTIFVAGAGGMVGSSVVREVLRRGASRLLTPRSDELDLTDQRQVREFFLSATPDIVVLAAAAVGGIDLQLSRPADLLYRNLLIQSNTIHAAFESGVRKLVFVSSSCVYPRDTGQPMREEQLLQGDLEPTTDAYAVAKIAGIKLCESYFRQHGSNFFALTPPNLYGPRDKFDIESSHVIAALIARMHRAKLERLASVGIWGTGSQRREFLYADDLARAIVFALDEIDSNDIYGRGISHLNIGTGSDLSIRELAVLIGEIVGFDGELRFDRSRPDGARQKLLDISRIREFGWKHEVDLREGLEKTFSWYLNNSLSPEPAIAGRVHPV